MPSNRRRTALSAALGVPIWAAPLFALWLALTDNTRFWDMVAGGACALLAGALAQAVVRVGAVGFAPRPGWLLRCARAPWWVLRDSVLVLGALLGHLLLRRPLGGRIVAVPFEHGDGSPRGQARRALAFGAGSAGPNSFVVGASAEDRALVVHQLVDSDEVTPLEIVGEP
jgi:hypothetical protein